MESLESAEVAQVVGKDETGMVFRVPATSAGGGNAALAAGLYATTFF
jgi:hypothetical protein